VKNQVQVFVLEVIEIPSFSSVMGNCKRDGLLCPVRALHFYLDNTNESRSHLFLPIKTGQEDISAKSVSIGIV